MSQLPLNNVQEPQQQSQPQVIVVQVPKSRFAYILLALFLGGFGIHNFYAGYVLRGVSQLLFTFLLGWLIFPLFFLALWIILEILITNKDALGIKMS